MISYDDMTETTGKHQPSETFHLFLFIASMTSPGSITISGVVILQSPRPIDPQKGPRNVVFDANFCIVEGSQTVTMALLRYFAPNEMTDVIQNIKQKAFQKAFIVANVHQSRLSSFQIKLTYILRRYLPSLPRTVSHPSCQTLTFLTMHSSVIFAMYALILLML
jgi:hypothetical protein